MDKREEMLAWAKSLKPGDKVVYISSGFPENNLSILEVAKVTPAGWIKTTNEMTFAQNSWDSSIKKRGTGWGEIVPVTDELLKKIQQQDAERAEIALREKTISKAREIILREWGKSNRLTYDRAVKIIAAFEDIP